jgi:hypothetical protein
MWGWTGNPIPAFSPARAMTFLADEVVRGLFLSVTKT